MSHLFSVSPSMPSDSIGLAAPRLLRMTGALALTAGLSAAALAQAPPTAASAASGPATATVEQGNPTPEPPQPTPSQPPKFDYQVGLALILGPSYWGSADQGATLMPVFGLQYGRFRLSNSRASLIERSGGQGTLPGASMELGQLGKWRFDAALRLDRGRKSSSAPELRGLPDVDSTLRLRLLGEYMVSEDTRAALNLSTDIANKKGGSVLSLDIGRGGALAPAWRWNAGVGVVAADATYMNSFHGIPPGTSSPWPVYQPSGGWHDARAGAGLTWRIAPHWRAGAALGASYLLGPAAASPLTERRMGVTATLGLVYIGKP
ncbi:MipA/OmpV family protein [Ideonella sp.]|uniref:MipA/OmpV family protein n=1 Tax=Ideonella sp. TaxID=1929293 RepID=UPI0037C07635